MQATYLKLTQKPFTYLIDNDITKELPTSAHEIAFESQFEILQSEYLLHILLFAPSTPL